MDFNPRLTEEKREKSKQRKCKIDKKNQKHPMFDKPKLVSINQKFFVFVCFLLKMFENFRWEWN